MTGLYEQSIKLGREKSAKQLADAIRSYNSLEDTDSQYAHEHMALIAVLKGVDYIWRNAPEMYKVSDKGQNHSGRNRAITGQAMEGVSR